MYRVCVAHWWSKVNLAFFTFLCFLFGLQLGCLAFQLIKPLDIRIVVDAGLTTEVLANCEYSASLYKLFVTLSVRAAQLAAHNVVSLVSLQANALAEFLNKQVFKVNIILVQNKEIPFIAYLIRNFAGDCRLTGVQLVALPAGVFRAILGVGDWSVWLSASICKSRWFRQAVNLEVIIVQIGKKVFLCSRLFSGVSLEPHRFGLLLSCSWWFTTESFESLKEWTMRFTLIEFSIKQISTRIITSCHLRGRCSLSGRLLTCLRTVAWQIASFKGRLDWGLPSVGAAFHRRRGKLTVVSVWHWSYLSTDIGTIGWSGSLALSRLWYWHAFVMSDQFNALQNLKLVSKRHLECIEVLIVQLKDCLFILDTILNETIFVLVESNGLQEGTDFGIFNARGRRISCTGIRLASWRLRIFLCLSSESIWQIVCSHLYVRIRRR